MPILNRAAEMQDEIAGWRRHLHQIPEINFDLYHTSAFVAREAEGIRLRRGRDRPRQDRRGGHHQAAGWATAPTVGLRADMDALPIAEATGQRLRLEDAGAMHACGHDGHTAMLLGAAKYLAETRNFAGTVAVIFQPAEEGGGGGNVMVQEGMMERFGIDKVFGMHNMPGLPIGQFAIRPGPIMAATAEFTIEVNGKGGHAAMPHRTDRPDRGRQPDRRRRCRRSPRAPSTRWSPIVVTVTKFHGGDAYNVIPERCRTRRHRAHAEARRSATSPRSASARICEGIARGVRRHRRGPLQRQLSGDVQPPRGDRLRRRRRGGDRRRDARCSGRSSR